MTDSRLRIWFALFVLAVFCAGGAGGFILGRHLPAFRERGGPPGFERGGPGYGRGAGRFGGPPPLARGPGAPGLPPEIESRIVDELNLDEAQRRQLRTVLDDHRARLEQVHRDARGRFDNEQRELRAAIRALLRPDQVQRFDQFISGRRQ